jgi:hypothetical protein
VLGGTGSNAVLYKTCSVLLYVLEYVRVDNSSAGSNWLKAGPVANKEAILNQVFLVVKLQSSL